MEDKTTISFRIGSKEKDALDKIAALMQRYGSFVLNEAIVEFLQRQETFTASIKRGLAQAKAGEFASDEEVESACRVGAMRVRWTPEALSQLREARQYIAEDDPKTAKRVAAVIRGAADQLGFHPRAGRPGRVEGTRELVISGTPYILVYAVLTEEVAVLTVLHGAQLPVIPPTFRRSPRGNPWGDKLVVWKLDRLGRDLRHLVNTGKKE